jgi:site-specific DNA-methyltransferase (adenine-specific)/adenine-specific DNA-methyltransferase
MLSLRKKIGNNGERLEQKPFTLCNAGLYDFETLRNLPWEDWRSIALQLFECKDEPHKIRGFQLDGKRQGYSVYVYNHFKEGQISRDTVSDLHANIGKQIGEKCFIVAPRGAFLFQEDYIELDGVRYYALRIPYSYINELHRRAFSALTQPNDEMAVNETVEAVGFDFIQPPVVDFELKGNGKGISIKIKKFESKARVRGKDRIDKFDALSMVMVDFDYKENVFDLDRVFYASSLKENGWKIEFSHADIIGDVMLVFLDIYGNESKVLIEKKKLTQIAKSKSLRNHAKK